MDFLMKDLTYSMDMNQSSSEMLPQKWKLFSFYAERRSKCKLSKK